MKKLFRRKKTCLSLKTFPICGYYGYVNWLKVQKISNPIIFICFFFRQVFLQLFKYVGYLLITCNDAKYTLVWAMMFTLLGQSKGPLIPRQFVVRSPHSANYQKKGIKRIQLFFQACQEASGIKFLGRLGAGMRSSSWSQPNIHI